MNGTPVASTSIGMRLAERPGQAKVRDGLTDDGERVRMKKPAV
jgi:hypothetical protein